MTEPSHNPLGRTLRETREAAHLSLRQLESLSGVALSTLHRLETGGIDSPRPEHLQRLARALRIDIEQLYGDAGYLMPEGLPELAPYLRAKYGLADQAVAAIDGYFQAVRDQQPSTKEGGHDQGDHNT